MAFFAAVLFGPFLLHRITSTAVNWGLAASWLSTVAGGAFAGSKGGPQGAGRSLPLKILLAVAPPLFLVGLLVSVASVVGFMVDNRMDALVPPATATASPASSLVNQALDRAYWQSVRSTPSPQLLIFLLLDIAAVAAVWNMTDVNVYSLNAMYANRLTRCYLGASRPRGKRDQNERGGAATTAEGPRRRANPLTGFDPDDDVPLCELRIGATASRGTPGSKAGATTYWGPQLIFNTSLNLVAGAELAIQDRKAESFFLGADLCGSKGTGYVETPVNLCETPRLGRAIAISGAAVDSNIGVHQSSALIALMTAFNARLGWWIKNPKSGSRWDASGPSAAYPLFWEILGRTDADKNYVHLSDGGHFENLGVYELIRRRCRYIVCVDAGTDRGASDDNLANMIRLVRTDFGVRIDVETGPLRNIGPDRLSTWHCAVGRIHYEDLDQGERPGVFVLLRTTMTGDEPPDVQEYAAKNPEFPLQSTLDQFFDESQFESYRALGHHVASTTFGDPLAELDSMGGFWSEATAREEFVRNNHRLFSASQRRWSAAPADLDSAFTSASRGWTGLQKMLRSDPALAKLSRDIYPELTAKHELANPPEPDRALIASIESRVRKAPRARDEAGSELHAVAQMLQVMEDAWVGLRMRGYRDLPMYRGWMSIFRRWAATDAVARHWPTLRVEFSQGFVRFCESELKLRAFSDAIIVRGDEPFVEASIERLDAVFAREWPDERLGPASLRTRVLADRSRAGKASLWLIVQSVSEPAGKLDPIHQYACGVAGLVKRDGGGLTLFIWIEPAYRATGIGGSCAKRFLKGVQVHLDADENPRDVFASFPGGASASEDNMDFELWKNFFARYDFKPAEDANGHESKSGMVLFKKKYPGPTA